MRKTGWVLGFWSFLVVAGIAMAAKPKRGLSHQKKGAGFGNDPTVPLFPNDHQQNHLPGFYPLNPSSDRSGASGAE